MAYARGRLTQTAKAGVSQKRSFSFTIFLLTPFLKNALLRPADFFDSLNIRFAFAKRMFSYMTFAGLRMFFSSNTALIPRMMRSCSSPSDSAR